MPLQKLEHFVNLLCAADNLVSFQGQLKAIGPKGMTVTGLSEHVALGSLVQIAGSNGHSLAEVVFIDRDQIVAKPLVQQGVVHFGDKVKTISLAGLCPTEKWKGRVVSGLGEPLDGAGPLAIGTQRLELNRAPPPAAERRSITNGVKTGIRALDIFTPLCAGQRMGIFAGSGVGKSTLMGQLARAAQFDCVIVGLIGERGREVQDFVRLVLGAALKKAIVVVATSDETASLRKRAALLATGLAEHFRDDGQNVLLLMDSVTRYAQALRELALAGGEAPVSRGYPPSVFSDLPKLLERSGTGPANGAITGIYSVLVEGDNHNEPIADAIRGTLDGHIVLERQIAASGRYPAIDILNSVSRLIDRALSAQELSVAIDLRQLISRYENSKDLRAFGGYQAGKDLELDRAVAFVPKLYAALNQSHSIDEGIDAFSVVAELTMAGRA